MVVFQFYRHIYYRVSQPISEGAELKVWIGRDYANLLGLGMGRCCPTGLLPCVGYQLVNPCWFKSVITDPFGFHYLLFVLVIFYSSLSVCCCKL